MRIVTYSTTNLVSIHKGTLPILLTCPHDGESAPLNVNERTEERTPGDCTGTNRFRTGRDTGSADVTRKVAQRMYEVFGESPYVVIAEFSRRFIDANRLADERNANCAFVDSDARRYYDQYHNTINSFINEILHNNNNRGFLFDMHGTGVIAEDPADIYIGTRNGATLMPGYDRDNLFKPRGLVGLMQAAKYKQNIVLPVIPVFPPPPPLLPAFVDFTVSPANATIPETGEVNGGFTVANYGKIINAIQIELAPGMRSEGNKKDFLIEELAYTLVNFSKQYTGV